MFDQIQIRTHRSRFGFAYPKRVRFFGMASRLYPEWFTEGLSIWASTVLQTVKKTWKVFSVLGGMQTISWMSHGKYFANFPNIQWYWYVITFLFANLYFAIKQIYQLHHAHTKQIPIIEELNQRIGFWKFLKVNCSPSGYLTEELKTLERKMEKEIKHLLDAETKECLAETSVDLHRITAIISLLKRTAIEQEQPLRLASRKSTNRNLLT
jgi:hypothetical protein